MGKSLVIIGADFSENAIVNNRLIIDRSNEMANASTEVSTRSAPYADKDYQLLQNKHIEAIEFKPRSAGTLSIVKASQLNSGGHEVLANINIASEDVDVVTKYDVDINVGANDIIGIVVSSNTGRFYYSADAVGFYSKVGNSGQSFNSDYCLCINWYARDNS